MRTRPWMALSLAIAALSGAACKKKAADSGAGSGTAAGTAVGPGTAAPTPPPPPPPAARPSQGPLATLPPLPASTDPANAAKVALGKALFFEKQLSVDGTKACYSCHLNENGTGGADPLAVGAGGKPLPRHSPALWNIGYADGAFYWDGRADSLEAQAKAAWAGGNMGVGDDKLEAKAAEVAKLKAIAPLWKAAFGDGAATAAQVTEALAAYERTLVCNTTPYDKFAAGDKAALTEAQQRGYDVFMTKGMCTACHTPPHFTAAHMTKGGVYWNAGIGYAGKDPAAVDIGRKKVTNKDTDMGAFKVPTLRGVASSAPYFHDGSVATLEEAVKYMAGPATANPNLSPLFNDKGLTPAELADLTDFVGNGLACSGGFDVPADWKP